jgi:cytidine deaminase
MYKDITAEDQKVIDAAIAVIKKNYCDPRHTVGSAVLCEGGKIFSGVNVESCGYGPCAEAVAIGTAISSGERTFKTIVALVGGNDDFPIIPPCGNCRQMLLDYAPEIEVILPHDGKAMKAAIKDLLPDSYNNF